MFLHHNKYAIVSNSILIEMLQNKKVSLNITHFGTKFIKSLIMDMIEGSSLARACTTISSVVL